MPANTVIKLRRDTAANWTTADSVLATGEPGVETDTGKLKFGDGASAWTSLSYSSGGASVEVGDSYPVDPEPNTLWWDSSDGTLYIYYDSFWVEAVASSVGATGSTGTDGSDGADGATGDIGIITSASAPANTEVLWVDTSEAGDAVLPLAGTTGQVLSKVDGTDYNTEWTDASYVPAVGTNDQVLTVVAGAPAWADAAAGGHTLISTTSIGTTGVTISSIPQTFTNLMIIGNDIAHTDGGNSRLRVRINNTSTRTQLMETSNQLQNYTDGSLSSAMGGEGPPSNFVAIIYNYTTARKHVGNFSGTFDNDNRFATGLVNSYSSSAVTSIRVDHLSPYGGTFSAGTVQIWGVA
jgi:hypothetical protein